MQWAQVMMRTGGCRVSLEISDVDSFIYTMSEELLSPLKGTCETAYRLLFTVLHSLSFSFARRFLLVKRTKKIYKLVTYDGWTICCRLSPTYPGRKYRPLDQQHQQLYITLGHTSSTLNRLGGKKMQIHRILCRKQQHAFCVVTGDCRADDRRLSAPSLISKEATCQEDESCTPC